MVHVSRLEPGRQQIRAHKTSIRAFVQRVVAEDGTARVHLSTFGSPERESAPKSSQSLQFDERSAKELVRYFHEIFGEDLGSAPEEPGSADYRDGDGRRLEPGLSHPSGYTAPETGE